MSKQSQIKWFQCTDMQSSHAAGYRDTAVVYGNWLYGLCDRCLYKVSSDDIDLHECIKNVLEYRPTDKHKGLKYRRSLIDSFTLMDIVSMVKDLDKVSKDKLLVFGFDREQLKEIHKKDKETFICFDGAVGTIYTSINEFYRTLDMLDLKKQGLIAPYSTKLLGIYNYKGECVYLRLHEKNHCRNDYKKPIKAINDLIKINFQEYYQGSVV